jgi:pimeloyl-ACP methyl ester carboxylesterase
VWRYRRFLETAGDDAGDVEQQLPSEDLWDAVGRLEVPLMLVRGMRTGSVVDDGAEAELLRRQPSVRVEHVAEAGHSVQRDDPLTLARLIDDFVPA